LNWARQGLPSGVFGGGCVGLKRGRAFGRCFLAGKQLGLKSCRRVRRVPELTS